MVCSDPGEKVTKKVQMAIILIGMCQSQDAVLTLRLVAKIHGVFAAGMNSVDATRIRVMELHSMRLWLMEDPAWAWDRQVPVPNIPNRLLYSIIEEMQWWIKGYDALSPHTIHWNGKYFLNDTPMCTIYTDACNHTMGVWVPKDIENDFPMINRTKPFTGSMINAHITLQETVAGVDGVLETLKERNYSNGVICTRVDATVAVKYLRCLGGKKSKYTAEVMELQQELRDRRLINWVTHIKGEDNPADKPSRTILGLAEYKLSSQVFQWMNNTWGPFTLDLFAARWNHQLPRYVTYTELTDPKAAGRDAMAWPLQNETGVIYCFPPPHKRLLVMLVQRLRLTRTRAVLILPIWQSEWLTMSLQMATDLPVLLECNSELLRPPEAYSAHEVSTHQWWKSRPWTGLIGVPMQHSPEKNGAFQARWQRSLNSSTSQIQVDTGACILMQRGASCRPISEKLKPQALLVSQILCSVMQQEHT
jgi:hypothetical protein